MTKTLRKLSMVLLSVIVIVCILSSALVCYAGSTAKVNGYPFGKPASSAVAKSTQSNTGGIQILVNDNSAWYAGAGINATNGPRTVIGPYEDINCTGYSRSRTAYSGGDIRDIDYIYIKIRAYDKPGTDWMLKGETSNSATLAADVSASLSEIILYEANSIFYGTHIFKEAGYNDIQLDTSDNSY